MELLVVIAIIGVLASMLLPALKRAKQKARDIYCTSTMRQALIAVFTYNADYGEGLQNYRPNCPWWGKGWEYSATYYPDTGGTHPWHVTSADYSDSDGSHVWNEMRSYRSYWRGYLLAGEYVPATVLGCTAKDYRGNSRFRGSYGFFDSHNHVEPSSSQDSFKRTPAFIWYGPPALYYEVAWNTGGHLYTYQNGHNARGQYVRRGALFVCGTPWVSDNTTDPKMGEMPHRDWIGENNDPMYNLVPFAGNIGMNDGSVAFYDVATTVLLKP